ncbi:MAG: transposase [Zymomonas mobilis]
MHRSPAINGLIVAGISNIWARLKEWHAVATRYEKTATSFLTVIHIAALAD